MDSPKTRIPVYGDTQPGGHSHGSQGAHWLSAGADLPSVSGMSGLDTLVSFLPRFPSFPQHPVYIGPQRVD